MIWIFRKECVGIDLELHKRLLQGMYSIIYIRQFFSVVL